MKKDTEDVNVAVFVQNLLNQSQAQDITDQRAFGGKEAEVVLTPAKTLPPRVIIVYRSSLLTYLNYTPNVHGKILKLIVHNHND